MDNIFKELRDIYGSHKAASRAIGVSYTRYNEWRWRPEDMPERAKKHVRLFYASAIFKGSGAASVCDAGH